MAHPVLRFAHVSNVRLDEPLRGVGQLPGAERRTAEDAPRVAWERVIEACVDRDVEFLLLTPQTIAGSWSLVDSHDLLDGFRQLQEFGIRVYWSASPDETTAQEKHVALPDNVTLLNLENPTAVVIREGRAVATLHQGRVKPFDDIAGETVSVGPRPLQIVIPTEPGVIDQAEASGRGESPTEALTSPDRVCDYVAGWGSSCPRSITARSTVWSDPGTPQSRSADEGGAGGIAIVEWDETRIGDVQRASTATVCWERRELGIAPETTSAEFTERMQLALSDREPGVGEQLWIVEWHIEGSGPLFDSLLSDSTRRDVEQAAGFSGGDPNRPVCVHRWELNSLETGMDDSIDVELQEWLAQEGQPAWSSIRRELEDSLRHTDESIAADGVSLLSPTGVCEASERRLRKWLCSAAREAL